ncbi:host cell division inhibitor Icd-like protein [Testudinibacter sp. TR-2022]|uniref:host cell division inhibitor Icd-like protein n=1 Tax=Testudinibacter sp. TR-2022 TaxID=2585029 RepID=UPI001118AB43|nr:host cell division inhibitor Icd-like protein [Testudinibacter sp. TR-2022]TNH07974.1 host cell division inhibitor Icd-like protein [Pasteurellaceae bacterium Phil11]TNH23190.1 host cell division inhibitor Icd-like protein [Testudinibacter sp. TR-2022]TNH23872.1 host cell division inhibitor Icd-like protein [Testudinibacter sp. TR-2022]
MAKPDYTRKTISAQTLAAVSANGGHPTNIQKCDPNHFTSDRTLGYFVPAVAKSAAERDNSNKLSTAHSTPNNACFFMREIRTPKIDPSCDLFSMVACDGQRSIVGCFPLIAVCHPVARYRPSVTSKAVTLKQFINGVTAMIYLFIGINRTDTTNQIHRLRIAATSEQQARAILARDYVLCFAGRINRTLTTSGLTAAKNAVSISNVEATHLDKDTARTGHRTRQTCGFFILQIPTRGLLPHAQTEFAVQMTGGNKASNRTNNAGSVLAVVESVSHPMGGTSILTKLGQSIMKTQPNTATHAPIALSADVQGVAYA